MYIDNIRDIVWSLPSDDRKEFRAFINRQRVRKNRKDLELFEILCLDDPLKPREIVKKLYGNENMNAYHSIRKRLLKHLTDFIVIKQMDDDTTSASSVMGLLSLSRYLFDNGNSRPAWVYLNKAEDLALSTEQYDLIDNIINVQLANASNELAPPIDDIITKWRENKRLADEDERANVANTIIQLKLEEYRIHGADVDLKEHVNAVIDEYILGDAMLVRPKLLYNFMSIVRSAVIASKDYVPFEQMVIESYHGVADRDGFAKQDHYYKLGLLYMISHVLYRVRKFDKALEYLEIFRENLDMYNKTYHKIYYPKYILLYATVKSYVGQNEDSIEVMEDAIANSGNKISVNRLMDMKLNLSVYYFQQERYRDANRVLYQFDHTDKWLSKKMGKEWVIRKNLIEILIQYELGNVEIAMNRIKAFERAHKDILELFIYERVKTFLSFVKDTIDKPYLIATEEYFQHVDETLQRWPIEIEDIQAIAFFCWIKARMMKMKYYHVLVETVNGRMTGNV